MTPRPIRRLFPSSLSGQLIALLLLALIVAQAISLFVFAGERREALASANRFQMVDRVVTVVRLLGETDAGQHDRVLSSANSSDMRLWLANTSAVGPADEAGGRKPQWLAQANTL